jgi:cation transport ATPase
LADESPPRSFHPVSQAITTTAAYTTRATSGNLNVQMINQLELHVYKMTDKNEILTITTQLASIARTESAQASVSTHLLETEREQRRSSKNDRRVISKAKVIGRRELERLRKKKIADSAKAEDKKRKRHEEELEGPTGKRRKTILKELQNLKSNQHDIRLDNEGTAQ